MATPDGFFYDGFDKYGVIGMDPSTGMLQGEWQSVDNVNVTYSLVAALSGTGCACKMTRGGGVTPAQRILGANYARVIGGVTFSTPLVAPFVFIVYDGTTAQCTVSVETTGNIKIYRGSNAGTVLGTSSEVVAINSVNCLEWDFTIDGAAGIMKVWLNGTLLTGFTMTGLNNKSTANSYFNRVGLGLTTSISGSNVIVDHFYNWYYTSGGGSETPCLDNPIIETDLAVSDDTAGFTVGAHACPTSNYMYTGSTFAAGSNIVFLRQITMDAAGTATSLQLTPNTTSATAKFKAVIYADSAGVPGALSATGTEVVGTVSGTVLSLPISLAGLTAGTKYWIGYITDTGITMRANAFTGASYSKTNTYTSGPPSPAGTGFTTTTNNVNMLLTMTSVTTLFSQEEDIPSLGDSSYNQSSTVTARDLFNFASLSVTPTSIHGIAVKAYAARSDSGARTMNVLTKSSAAVSTGNASGFTPAVTYAYVGSYFFNDPNTGTSWGATGLNSAKHGYEIAS